MARRNDYPGRCDVCGSLVQPLEGIVDATDDSSRYLILCPEHAPTGTLDPPKRPSASKLSSIHLDEDRYER